MNHSNVVSVIIPVYNTAEYVERCVKSVSDQTYKELEIIIVDDGSTDDSLEICKGLQKLDKRIAIVLQSNRGASMARNTGLEITKGDYIMFVDSDDWIEHDMIENLLIAIETTGSDLVISPVPGDPQLYNSDITISSHQALHHLLCDQAWWSPYGKLFHARDFKALRFPKATISEDYKLMSELLIHDLNVRFVSSSYYHRTRRIDSLSRSSLNNRSFEEVDNVLAVLEKVKICVPNYEQYAERNLAETLLKLAIMLFSSPNDLCNYQKQEQRILSLIRSHYFDMMRNHAIPFKQKILLTGCITPVSARVTARLYHRQ